MCWWVWHCVCGVWCVWCVVCVVCGVWCVSHGVWGVGVLLCLCVGGCASVCGLFLVCGVWCVTLTVCACKQRKCSPVSWTHPMHWFDLETDEQICQQTTLHLVLWLCSNKAQNRSKENFAWVSKLFPLFLTYVAIIPDKKNLFVFEWQSPTLLCCQRKTECRPLQDSLCLCCVLFSGNNLLAHACCRPRTGFTHTTRPLAGWTLSAICDHWIASVSLISNINCLFQVGIIIVKIQGKKIKQWAKSKEISLRMHCHVPFLFPDSEALGCAELF